MHKTHRIVSALLLALLCSLLSAALTGCNEKQNATAPTEAVTPTAEVPPTDKVTPIAEATPTSGVTPTAEATPTAVATPTTEATPTAAPTATPTETPTIDYGDLTQYFSMTAGEIIDKIGQKFQYQVYGYDFLWGTNGLIRFDQEVGFSFDDCPEKIDKSLKPLVIHVNTGKRTTGLSIGDGIDSSMKYSQLKAAFGDAWAAPTYSEEYGEYMNSCYRNGYRYIFWWGDKDPAPADAAPASIDFSKDGLVWIVRSTLTQYINSYLSKNASLVKSRSEALLAELRSACKDAPVAKSIFLQTVKVDEHYSIDLYELAGYGHPLRYDDDNENDTAYAGYETGVECFLYKIAGRIFYDGAYVSYSSASPDAVITGSNGDFPRYDISVWLTVGQDDLADEEQWFPNGLKTYNIENAGGKTRITGVSIMNYPEETRSFCIYADSFFVNDETAPALVYHHLQLLTNDGGTDEPRYFGADGSEIKSIETLKKVGSGSRTVDNSTSEEINRETVTWTKNELSKGVQILTVKTYNEKYETKWSDWRYFLIADDCVVYFGGDSDF